ncbi:bifunctional folylpolyglutamate synthase/dihydrofolate synthase [Paenibacillus sp. S33]
MEYLESINYVSNLSTNITRHRMEFMSELLKYVGEPHKHLKFIHIAGTNGKGTTANYISNILKVSGYRVGLYTSPHMEIWNERIKINQKLISDQDFANTITSVRNAIEKMDKQELPTIAQVLTATALLYFYQNQCDIVVLETGCGGKNDPTNVIPTPELAVITKLSLDHTNYFGNSILDIAKEKAGIIKNNTDTIVYPQSSIVTDLLHNQCLETQSNLFIPSLSNVNLLKREITKQLFEYKGFIGEIYLLGQHQLENAIVAIEAAIVLSKKGYQITPDSINNGLKSTKWTGRTEVINTDPVFILDGAHNIDGIEALANSLIDYFYGEKITFIYGGLNTKDNETMLRCLAPIADNFLLIPYDYPRAVPTHELVSIAKEITPNYKECSSIEEAIKLSLEISTSGIICVAGSTYYFKPFKEYFSKKRKEGEKIEL